MKARVWFHALGQSHEGRYTYQQVKALFGGATWPQWARLAYLNGRYAGRRA